MGVIYEAGSCEAYRVVLEPMDRGELIAQQLVQRGAIHMLETLIRDGGSIELARAMLESCQHGLHLIHEIAHKRGIELISYSEE